MSLSTFLNNRAPSRLRGVQWLSFSDVAVIQSRTMTDDGGGGGTATWAAKGTTHCRIYPVTMRGRTGLIGGQIDEHSTHFCQMPVGTPVTTSDRVVIANRGTFEVTLALETTDELSTRVEVFQVS